MDIKLFLQSLTVQEKAAILINIQMELDEEKKEVERMKVLDLKNQPEETFFEWFSNNEASMGNRLRNMLERHFIAFKGDGRMPISDVTLSDIRKIRGIGTSSLAEFEKLRGY